MILENFSNEKQWQKFLEEYKEANSLKPGRKERSKTAGGRVLDSLYAEEDLWPFITGAFFKSFDIPLLLVTSTFERADQLEKEIKSIIPGTGITRFDSLGNSLFYRNKTVNAQNLAKRLTALRKLTTFREDPRPFIIVATSSALLNLMPGSRITGTGNIEVCRGTEYGREKMIRELNRYGYERVSQVYDRGEFAVRGEIIDIFDITQTCPTRIIFLEDEVEKIFSFDILAQKPSRALKKISVFPNTNPWRIDQKPGPGKAGKMVSLIDLMEKFVKDFAVVVCDPMEVYLKVKSDIDIISKVLERDKGSLAVESSKIKQSYLAGRDFLESRGPYLKLNLMSTDSKRPGSNEFRLTKIKKQKRCMGNSISFAQNIKKDLKSLKTVVVSIGGNKRRKKIEEILLDNAVSFKHLKPGSSGPYDSLKPDIAYILPRDLYGGYISKEVSLYGELDIYEEMEHEISGTGTTGSKDFTDFKPGEYVVHKNHGIGKYVDIISRQLSGIKREYFLIEYAGSDRLYVPTWQADRISRYIGARNPAITSLSSRQWDNLKKKVRRSVQKLAIDLAKLYAERESARGYTFAKDSPWQKEIEELFPFKETPDQIKAIDYVKKAMQKPKPMDVLVIGDVGFGKTEVAIRAAFKAIEEGKQVLMLVPTTILAGQHYNTFKQRYHKYPVILDVLSRFRTRASQKEIIKDFNDKKIDMLIGTHRILQKDIIPRDLGLIIVDEEQRFGVGSKEKIKLLKTEVDVLTLSATPIPRTLYMSLAGVKDIALIETHPEGRNPIETFVGEMDYSVARMAIEREIARGGQIYYVYNRISGIRQKKDQLEALIPDARIALTHGRMDGNEIEEAMSKFIEKEYDILLTTSIIESGMDIENVNTMVVEGAHQFGLSQLYQLRGRVGRSSEKAYAYLFYPSRKNMSPGAYQRLKALTEYTELGSGYNIAMRDLEIRGAGEILGPRQHGHINSVGFDMYCQIMKEEIEKLKGKKVEEDINVQIELPLSAYIPKNYIKGEKDRVNIYRQLGFSKSFEDIGKIRENMESRFGMLPEVVDNLIGIAKIKCLLKKAKVEKIFFKKGKGVILKKIDIASPAAEKIKNKNKNIVYEPSYGQVTIKNINNNIDLGLVIKSLDDIIRYI